VQEKSGWPFQKRDATGGGKGNVAGTTAWDGIVPFEERDRGVSPKHLETETQGGSVTTGIRSNLRGTVQGGGAKSRYLTL